EKERQEKARLQDQIERQKLEKERDAASERERVRLATEAAQHDAAEARARELVATAATRADPLEAARDITDALAVLPRTPGSLRSEVEAKKLELVLRLARDSIKADDTGLASFWIRQAHALGSAATKDAVEAVEADIARLRSGEAELEEARRFARAGDPVAARAKLEHALAQGVAAKRVETDLGIVAK